MMKKEVSYKDVENMLYSLNSIKASVVDIQIEICSVNDYMGITGAGENDIKPTSPTNAFNSNVENEIVNKEQRITQLERLKRAKQLQVDRIENMLTTLREDERELVEYKYFKKYSLNRIAGLLDLSYETVKANRRLIISSLVTFLNEKET